jgi:CheY-like chemotaxis protein
LRPVVEDKGITLDCQLDAESMVNCDPDRMQQVVWNLLSNAAKFTPGGGKITVRLEAVADLLRLSVADTGEGIDAEFLPHVFDRFRQADSSTSRRYTGLGIGLNIVRHIVELHGGTVTAESPGKGRGAIFSITLPRLSARVAAPQTPSTDATNRNAISLEGIRVLLVDDDADAREVVAEILRQYHADVAVAADVPEALGLIASSRFDVLLTDLAMPGQDGYALLRRIRSAPEAERGHLPAIALTAYAHPEDRIQVLAAGFNGHLAKPVSPAELVRAVQEHAAPANHAPRHASAIEPAPSDPAQSLA